MNNHPMPPFFLRADWDATVAAWVATSDDQPDFIVQAERLEALVKKVERRTMPTPRECCVKPPRSCRW